MSYHIVRNNTQEIEIVETVDKEYMILVNGFQWGGAYDLSGAGDAVFATKQEALDAYEASEM